MKSKLGSEVNERDVDVVMLDLDWLFDDQNAEKLVCLLT